MKIVTHPSIICLLRTSEIVLKAYVIPTPIGSSLRPSFLKPTSHWGLRLGIKMVLRMETPVPVGSSLRVGSLKA